MWTHQAGSVAGRMVLHTGQGTATGMGAPPPADACGGGWSDTSGGDKERPPYVRGLKTDEAAANASGRRRRSSRRRGARWRKGNATEGGAPRGGKHQARDPAAGGGGGACAGRDGAAARGTRRRRPQGGVASSARRARSPPPPRAVRVVRALDGPNRAGRATGRVGGDAERRHAPHARIARARGGGRGADWTRRARRCGGRLAKDDS